MDEMHTYIGSKKTIAGSGLLLIEMGNDFSTAKWVPATPKQDENYGMPLKIKT
jgi:transposase